MEKAIVTQNHKDPIVELKNSIKLETQARKLIKQYISSQLKEGTDYGKIHISSKCENRYSPDDCKNTKHWSKDSLFKPGAEKFAGMKKWTTTYRKDVDTWEMAGSKSGLFCYIAELHDESGRIVGEGRGACSVAEKANENNAIKIAKKRAKVDAVLDTGGLSDFFTQDIEDMAGFVEPAKASSNHIAKPASHKPFTPRMSEAQRKMIFALLDDKGKTKAGLEFAIKRDYEVIEIMDLNTAQASEVITKLMALPDVKNEEPKAQDGYVNPDDIPETLGQEETNNA